MATWATGLADHLRDPDAPGLRVEEVIGWEKRGRSALDSIECIVVHHTASRRTAGPFPSRRVLIEGRDDLPGPLCNLALTRGASPTWVVVAAGKANHAGAVRQSWQSNARALGVEAENDGVGEPWTPAVLDTLATGLALLAIAHDIPTSRILGHKEVCDPPGRKIDPSTSMSDLRDAVARERSRILAQRASPLMALTDADANKIAKAIVSELLSLDTIPDLGARRRGATGVDATVSLRTVLAYVYQAVQQSAPPPSI